MAAIKIGYPDGSVQVVALADGPCPAGKQHAWAASAARPLDASGSPVAGTTIGLRAECAGCHTAWGQVLDPPVAGDVTTEII